MQFTDDQFKQLLSAFDEKTGKGSFANFSTFYDGTKDSNVLEPFLAAVVLYKKMHKISDKQALAGLHFLLKDEAGAWWQRVKGSVQTWTRFITIIRERFTPEKPAYIIFHEIMSEKQLPGQSTEDFISKKRFLFSQLPKPKITECQQIDMLYCLLHIEIQNRLPRDTINSFDGLLEAAEEIEKDLYRKPAKVATNENSNRQKSGKLRCNYCRIRGHTAEVCLKRKKKMAEEAAAEQVTTAEVSSTDLKLTQSEAKFFCQGCGAPGVPRPKCPFCSPKLEQDIDMKNLE